MTIYLIQCVRKRSCEKLCDFSVPGKGNHGIGSRVALSLVKELPTSASWAVNLRLLDGLIKVIALLRYYSLGLHDLTFRPWQRSSGLSCDYHPKEEKKKPEFPCMLKISVISWFHLHPDLPVLARRLKRCTSGLSHTCFNRETLWCAAASH